MKLLYSLIIILYTVLIYLTSLFNKKARLWVNGRRGWRMDLKKHFPSGEKTIWVHCASLGEFEQGRPLMELIRDKNRAYRIIVTFFSPSGYEIRKSWPIADYICYLPADTPWNASEFISHVRPSAVLFVKYEFWNNYISTLYRNNIPVYLVSGIFRSDQHFFKWYGGFFRSILRKITHIFVQDEGSRELLSSLGISNVTVAGDTRFDRVSLIAATAGKIEIIERFRGGEDLFIAGSSWKQDEEIIAEYINRNPGRMKWIFAPHEIDSHNIARLESLITTKCCRYSDSGCDLSEMRVLIIDNIGLLSAAYSYASVAAVGGGFGKGIHNILEPACWGLPVLFGPNHDKFREAIDLIKEGGAFRFSDYEEFSSSLTRLLDDRELYRSASETARNYISRNRGATGKIVSQILP